MLVRSLGPVRAIAAARGIRAVGRMDGEYPLEEVTDDPRRVCGAARDIVVATLATAYPEVMQALAPWLGPRHRVVLFSGKFGGSLIATGPCEIVAPARYPFWRRTPSSRAAPRMTAPCRCAA